ELEWRGLLADQTEHAKDALRSSQVTGYIGFDPTADSLHVGTLVPIMGLVHLQRAGHIPLALVGGGTGLIGDPSGKTEERGLLSVEEVEANARGIRQQLERFLDFEAPSNPARMENNLEWLADLGFIEFLRDVGKHFSVNSMMRKESVRRRLEEGEAGISFTEFSYQLLQAYDFWELNQRFGCTLQMGGSDQWGNITAGIDLVRRLGGSRCHGLVFPLLTTASGTKFGKTEEGTVWLDPARTSPYRFYQFWLNTDDDDVVKQLRLFTLMEREEIDTLAREVDERPQGRAAQRRLAEDVTDRVHGRELRDRAERASSVLFGGSLDGLSADEIGDIFSDVPSSTVPRDRLAGGLDLVTLMAESGAASSKGEARRLISGGGVYLNAQRVEDAPLLLAEDHVLHGRFVVLRVGKKRYHLIEVVG
ncbi:MAG: tyrosine--tRNA ligase, partial [Gemmatimonadetes bacterium]|nr:tyrosine--tRNA ligase [Gemmatimonadota bacterium]